VVEQVLDGDLFAWGVLMHTEMMYQLNWCHSVDYSEFTFGSVLVAWFLERVPLLHPQILLEPTTWREPRLMQWVHVLSRHGGWPLIHDHGCLSVASYATCYSPISIRWYGLQTRPRHGATSWEPERYALCLFLYLFW
jgi:hypothetical protein